MPTTHTPSVNPHTGTFTSPIATLDSGVTVWMTSSRDVILVGPNGSVRLSGYDDQQAVVKALEYL